jgi:hypothetical protein
MSMVDNFAEKLNELRRFIQAHHPGATERSLNQVENSEGYFPLEFRRDYISCTLYISLDSFASESFMDENGNRWRKVTVKAEPSWPSYGSVTVNDANKFAELLIQVNAFAGALLKTFPEPFVKLVATAEQIAAHKQKAAEERSRADVQGLIRANIKGMKVGQERRVELPVEAPDLLPVGEVSYCDGPRQYTTHVTATRAFYVMRTA